MRTFLPLRNASGRSVTDFLADFGGGEDVALWRVKVPVPIRRGVNPAEVDAAMGSPNFDESGRLPTALSESSPAC